AIDIGDFSNDLATDLGPLLALFGDSMTKQFLSESISHLDYIIFAVAPIGIITTLVSTVRLCGSTALRAFIGRSQEGQGAVEAELCTSTSRDVCELFTRGGIQRILGRPSILELVYIPPNATSDSPSAGTEAKPSNLLTSREYFTKYASSSNSPWRKQRRSRDLDPVHTIAPNPNLSLNIGIRRPPGWILWCIACVGILLQLGVLVLAGTGVWILGWSLSEGDDLAARDYAPIMFIIGTILMCIGMWGCAFLIGQTTQELSFERCGQEATELRPRLLWLQPGPQVIGDQSFDPFVYMDDKTTVQVWSSSKKSHNKKFIFYTYLAVFATLIGYITQFIGIRGMKAWISLAQLAVTMIMSLLRGSLRTQRLSNEDNLLGDFPDLVAGHELDWLAFQLHGIHDPSMVLQLGVTPQQEKSIETIKDTVVSQGPGKGSDHRRAPQRAVVDLRVSSVASNSNISSSDRPSDSRISSDKVLQTRIRLANMTGLNSFADADPYQQMWDDGHVKVRAKARQIAVSIGSATTNWFLRNTVRRDTDISPRIRTNTCSGVGLEQDPISILIRPPPEFFQGGWRADAAQLEATLGLWMWMMMMAKSSIGFNSGFIPGSGEFQFTSNATKTPIGRIVSIGLDDSDWEKRTDVQGEMDLWLGRSSMKLRQSTITFREGQYYGLTSLFQRNQAGKLEPYFSPENSKEQNANVSQRLSGWHLTQRLLASQQSSKPAEAGIPQDLDASQNEAVTYRIQDNQLDLTSTSLLDVCCQELFVALMMSLINFNNDPLGNASFVEHEGSLRLEHPVVTLFVDAFVAGGLGTYADAILCIFPPLREKLTSLKPETMLPSIAQAATTYRLAGQWKQAETVLWDGCRKTEQKGVDVAHFEAALLMLCELYRSSLLKTSDTNREFALKGISSVIDTYANMAGRSDSLQQILDRYREIVKRYTNGTSERDQTSGTIHTDLLLAIESRNRTEALYQLSLITPLCERGSSVPTSALALAARNNWLEVVGNLLELKAQPNDADQDGKRGLYYCAELGNLACAQILIGVDADDSLLELTPLACAAANGHTDIIRLLIDTIAANVEHRTTKELTPLILAVEGGHEEAAMLLVEKGANIEANDRSGQTALVYAVQKQNLLLVKQLIEKGANVNTQDKTQRTPLIEACLLVGDPAPVDGGSGEAHDARLKEIDVAKSIVDLLLRNGADAETKNWHDLTALAMVAQVNLGTSASNLIAHGANLEAKDDHLCTPLMHAVKGVCTAVVPVLLQAGANVEAKDARGFTPLFL
ncbi:hypothetical protein CC86DRAFT_240039, partial [Ophiobolus disseminans]